MAGGWCWCRPTEERRSTLSCLNGLLSAPPRTSALLESLNPAQREAVEHDDGPLLVLAGAGSGKTRVLTLRIARLVQDRGIDPAHILAVTFTNKAAGEMRDRMERVCWAARPRACGWEPSMRRGRALLRANAWRCVGRTSQLHDLRRRRHAGRREARHGGHGASRRASGRPRRSTAAISDAMNALVSPSRIRGGWRNDPLTRAAAGVYADLEGALRSHNAVTFDDLLALPVRILTRATPTAAQPTRIASGTSSSTNIRTPTAPSMRSCKLLGAHGNVTVVGDDDQVVYQWRGADIRNILDFERDFPQATVVRLEENYRSTGRILELANAVIAANTQRMGKTLRTTKEMGERSPSSSAALDERDEAAWVAEEIAAPGAVPTADLALRDIAILYRTNAQSRAFEEAMRRQGSRTAS